MVIIGNKNFIFRIGVKEKNYLSGFVFGFRIFGVFIELLNVIVLEFRILEFFN